jgi:hypothetical protein
MTNEQILQIKEWLKFGRKDHMCPFHYDLGSGQICMELFPKIIKDKIMFMTDRPCGILYECPCTVYGIEEVVARAEEVVEEYEIQDNS